MITRLGANFGWEALHGLVDRAANDAGVTAITETLRSTPDVREIHDLRTRKMGDLIQVDVHFSVDGHLTVVEGHDVERE